VLSSVHSKVLMCFRMLQVNPKDEAALAVVHRDPGLSPEQRAQSLQTLLQVKLVAEPLLLPF
jgi:hypothetical protein